MDGANPADYKPVIDSHKHESLAVLFTSESGCIEGAENLAVPGRRFRVEGGSALDFDPPDTCVVVVLLCPTDSIEPQSKTILARRRRPAAV